MLRFATVWVIITDGTDRSVAVIDWIGESNNEPDRAIISVSVDTL